jgi:hypothetical protein
MAALDRRPLAACLVALGLALAACGDDDEERAERTATSPETTPAETTATEEPAPETETEAETEEAEPSEPETETEAEPAPEASPEDQPGGAGDEEPARTLALFTGEGGRITPRVIRVPAYISIRVELRSGDGREYGLVFENETTRVQVRLSGSLGSVSSTLDGLRPGAAISGRPTPSGPPVRIEATAEPGP